MHVYGYETPTPANKEQKIWISHELLSYSWEQIINDCPMYECCVCTRHTGTVYIYYPGNWYETLKGTVVEIFLHNDCFTNWGKNTVLNKIDKQS